MSEFIYRELGNIIQFLNERDIPVNDRESFIELFKFKPLIWKKLKNDCMLTNDEKLLKLKKEIIENKDVICGVIGNQRMGKDTLICYILDEVKKELKDKCRIVTLGSTKRYPFENENEIKYFKVEDIPMGTPECPIYVYVSEMDREFNNYDWSTDAGKYLNKQVHIFAQNNIKIIGGCKLMRNIMKPLRPNINISCYKYVTLDKLSYEDGGTSFNMDYQIFLPKKPKCDEDKCLALVNIDDDYFTIEYPMPKWYNDDFSRQFAST